MSKYPVWFHPHDVSDPGPSGGLWRAGRCRESEGASSAENREIRQVILTLLSSSVEEGSAQERRLKLLADLLVKLRRQRASR